MAVKLVCIGSTDGVFLSLNAHLGETPTTTPMPSRFSKVNYLFTKWGTRLHHHSTKHQSTKHWWRTRPHSVVEVPVGHGRSSHWQRIKISQQNGWIHHTLCTSYQSWDSPSAIHCFITLIEHRHIRWNGMQHYRFLGHLWPTTLTTNGWVDQVNLVLHYANMEDDLICDNLVDLVDLITA